MASEYDLPEDDVTIGDSETEHELQEPEEQPGEQPEESTPECPISEHLDALEMIGASADISTLARGGVRAAIKELRQLLRHQIAG